MDKKDKTVKSSCKTSIKKKIETKKEIKKLEKIEKKFSIKEEVSNKLGKLDFKKIKFHLSNIYFEYIFRIAFFAVSFVVLFGICYLLFMKSFVTTESSSTTYQEFGTSDYKVMLKDNDFYDSKYLSKGRIYVSSLIKSINIDFNYRFMVDKNVDYNFNYTVIGKLSISNDNGEEFYSKEYVLLNKKYDKANDKNSYSTTQSISVDYEYYNNIANKYKSTYGVDATSNFIVTFVVSKNVDELGLNNSNQMSITIPLTKRSFSISSSDGINATNSLTVESVTKLEKKIYVVLAFFIFVGSVACLLRFLELLFKMFGKQSAYDKKLNKIFKEYDRFIVTTDSTPNFDNKNIVKISTFEELLDARDTLKQPIMYFNISEHNKCYFYIKSMEDVYLTVIKAVDLESDKDESKKNK